LQMSDSLVCSWLLYASTLKTLMHAMLLMLVVLWHWPAHGMPL